jgi:hypothetical protein
MKHALLILSLALASIFAFLWVTVLYGDFYRAHHPVKFTPEGFINTTPRKPLWFQYNYSIEFPQHGHIHLLLSSDTRGFVFDVFIAQIPPERAPGPPSSDASQKWLKPSAARKAAAYSRRFGFEKGIIDRHGQYLNDPIYFYGTDYYVAVPHVLLIFLFSLLAYWLLIQRLKLKEKDKPSVPSNIASEPTATTH